MLNVLNAIIFGIWHTKSQNMSFIRCFICAIFLKHATVRSQIWERTVYLYHNLYYFFTLAGPTSSISSSPLSSLCLLIPSLNCICSLTHFISLPSLSLLHVTASLSDETQARASSHATPHKPDLHSQIAVHQHSHMNPTHHIHNNPWPDYHAMPCHAAELVVPSTTSSEPPTIGFLSIGLQWWVLLLGLFDLGCGFVDLVVFFAVPITLVVFDVGFAFGFVWFAVLISLVVCVCFFLRWRWWMWVCADGGWLVLLQQWLLVAVVI